MSLQRQIDELTAHRASEWIEILTTDGPKEREAFVDWLRESRKNLAEFLTVAALDAELSKKVFKDLVDKEALLQRVSLRVSALSPTGGDLSDRTMPRSENRRRSWRRPLLAAAGLMTLALAATLAFNRYFGIQDFRTAQGEQRAIELSDGSAVLLNAASHLRAHLSASARDLELVSGEALFKVAHDARRPFVVRTHDTLVRAVGTQFNVDTRKPETVVSVLEGKVLVSAQPKQDRTASRGESPTAVGAGEQARVDPQGKIDRPMRTDVSRAADWRRRRMVFRRTAIGDIVHVFNEHNAAPKMRLEGIEPDSRHYSAIFDVEDPGSFADFLGHEPDVVVEQRENELIVRKR